MPLHVTVVPPGGRDERMERVGVVLPAYNEERHVADVVRAAFEAGVGRVVVVNDCSADGTAEIVDRLAADDERVEALHHEVNQGKQAAVKHGLGALVRHADVEVVSVLDADMQNDPALLPGLCHLIGEYDLVIGARSRGDMPRIRRASNWLANLPYRVVGVGLHDIQSGYRVYSREAAERLAECLTTRGRYTFEHTSMLEFGKLAREQGSPFEVAEVDIPYTYQDAQSGIRMIDDLQLAWAAIYHAIALGLLRL